MLPVLLAVLTFGLFLILQRVLRLVLVFRPVLLAEVAVLWRAVLRLFACGVWAFVFFVALRRVDAGVFCPRAALAD